VGNLEDEDLKYLSKDFVQNKVEMEETKI